MSSRIQEVYVVGGHISRNASDKGNIFTVPSNQYAEFNMFLDPLAAKTVFQSRVNITLIPLGVQQSASSFSTILSRFCRIEKTPEAVFSKRLLARLYRLKQIHHRYQHMDTFLGEILGAVVMADSPSSLGAKFEVKPIKVLAEGVESSDGKTVVDEKHGKLVKILSNVDAKAYYDLYAKRLGDQNQSPKILLIRCRLLLLELLGSSSADFSLLVLNSRLLGFAFLPTRFLLIVVFGLCI